MTEASFRRRSRNCNWLIFLLLNFGRRKKGFCIQGERLFEGRYVSIHTRTHTSNHGDTHTENTHSRACIYKGIHIFEASHLLRNVSTFVSKSLLDSKDYLAGNLQISQIGVVGMTVYKNLCENAHLLGAEEFSKCENDREKR